MTNFNYSAPAEFFGNPGSGRQRRSITYRRFASGAEAVRFAVEGMSDALLVGVTLQTDDGRFDHRAIRALYDSTEYPLARQRGSAGKGRSAKEEGLERLQSPASTARRTPAVQTGPAGHLENDSSPW